MTLKIFSGPTSMDLARKVCEDYLGLPLGAVELREFSDGEFSPRFSESIRGADVFIIQSTSSPVNENLMKLLIMIDAARRASAERITAVIPYFGYARQDTKDQPRVPITAKLVANLITIAGANRILTIDLHTPQIQGFFDIPLDHLCAGSVFTEKFAQYFQNLPNSLQKSLVVLAPDLGSIKIARAYAKQLENCPIAVIDKRRPEPNQVEVLNLIGKVKDKFVLIIDDIIDTGGTLVAAAHFAQELGAKEVYACCTHGVFSEKAIERIENSPISKLFISDTIRFSGEEKIGKIKIVSVAELLGEAIKRIHNNESISVWTDPPKFRHRIK